MESHEFHTLTEMRYKLYEYFPTSFSHSYILPSAYVLLLQEPMSPINKQVISVIQCDAFKS